MLTRTLFPLAASCALAVTLGGGLLYAASVPPTTPATGGRNLVQNSGFEKVDAGNEGPDGFTLTGAARWIYVGYPDEITTPGVTLEAYDEKERPSGSVSQLVKGIDPAGGKWLRFTFRGLAEEGFTLAGDQLYMKMEFFSKNGANYLDSAERLIYREVEKDRAHFVANGNHGRAGGAVWRTYEFEELQPFPEVDAVRLTVGFKNGTAKSDRRAAFFVDDFSLVQLPRSSRGLVDPATKVKPVSTTAPLESGLVPLGGRWYYQPAAGESLATNAEGRLSGKLIVTEANADRLFYRDDRLVNPFAGNMTAWLRKGYLDQSGAAVKEDRAVPDNVTLTFDGGDAVAVRTHNLPNHPTARFPDTYGTQGYNPGYIKEQDDTRYLPLNPVPNPQAQAMQLKNENYALPMGPVGFAVNGVVFFNPFDANMMDASSLMDRCCGHPSPQDNRYHYHKYPICVNTPFVDKGERHSSVIGFAFDGIPVYGPYESAGTMAKDLKENPLNAFNAHQDTVRGWHYHVTPGKFPYLIGGYFGQVDARNFRRGPRRQRS